MQNDDEVPWSWRLPLGLDSPKDALTPPSRMATTPSRALAVTSLGIDPPLAKEEPGLSADRQAVPAAAAVVPSAAVPRLDCLAAVAAIAARVSPMPQTWREEDEEEEEEEEDNEAAEAEVAADEGPEQLLLESEAPVPWAWRLPLALHSPREEELGGTSAAQVPLATAAAAVARAEDVRRAMVTPITQRSRGLSPLQPSAPSFVRPPPPTTAAAAAGASAQSSSDVSIGFPMACAEAAAERESGGIELHFVSQLWRAWGQPRRIMQLVREAEQLQHDCETGSATLTEVYAAAVEAYGYRQESPSDDLRDLCVKQMRALCRGNDTEPARELHEKLKSHTVGTIEARLFDARSAQFARLGSMREAADVLSEGLEGGAMPASILQRALRRLRLQEKPDASVVDAAAAMSPPPRRAAGHGGISLPLGCVDAHETEPATTAAAAAETFAIVTAIPAHVHQVRDTLAANDAVSHYQLGPKEGGCSRDEQKEEALERDEKDEVEALRQQVQELQAELQHRNSSSRRSSILSGSSCGGRCQSSCCREAVEEAVAVLMDNVVHAAGVERETLDTSDSHEKERRWSAIAEEVWDVLASEGLGTSRRGSMATTSARGSARSSLCGSVGPSARRLSSLEPLTDLLLRPSDGTLGHRGHEDTGEQDEKVEEADRQAADQEEQEGQKDRKTQTCCALNSDQSAEERQTKAELFARRSASLVAGIAMQRLPRQLPRLSMALAIWAAATVAWLTGLCSGSVCQGAIAELAEVTLQISPQRILNNVWQHVSSVLKQAALHRSHLLVALLPVLAALAAHRRRLLRPSPRNR